MSYFTDDTLANSIGDNMTDLASDLVNDTGSNMTFIDIFIEELAFTMNVYYTPVLVLLGTIGNLLSIIVFFKSKLRAQSTSQYLSALAISDTVCLLQLIPPWLKAVRVSLIFGKFGFCQCFVYLTYVSSSSSSWLVVSFTVERFVAVLYPLRRTRMCTVRRARLLIGGIVFCCAAINTPVLKFASPKSNDCNIDLDLMDHAARFNVVDTVFSFTLPLSIITVLNIWIMIGVCQLSRARGHLMKQQGSCRPALARARRTLELQHRSQQRITRMLLIVSSVFVLLNLPAYSMRIVAYAKNMSSYEYSGRWAALQQICLLFFNTNFGINFFLYCMTGQNFRRALCQTFVWMRSWRAAAMRRCCARAAPRPAHTNSISLNTETSACAGAARLSHAAASDGPEPACRRRKGSAYATYQDMWRVNQLIRDNNRPEQCEMQVFPVRSHLLSPIQPERPEPRWPENSARTNFPSPVRPAIPRVISQTIFRPIRYNLIPGQVAPHRLSNAQNSPLMRRYQEGRCSPQSTSTSSDELESINTTASPIYRPQLRPTLTAQESPYLMRRYAGRGRTFPPSGDTSSDEIECIVMTTRPRIRRPQPRRRFSIPARDFKAMEDKDSTTDMEDVPAPRRMSPVVSAPAIRTTPRRLPQCPPVARPTGRMLPQCPPTPRGLPHRVPAAPLACS